MMRSPGASVLEFSGDKVSICGQTPVVLRAREGMSEGSPGPAAEGAVDSGDGSWSSAEETIRKVLAEVSGVPATAVLKSSNIYHLGLDSISAVKAVSLLRKRGLRIGLRDMLAARSISRMAQCVRKAGLAPVGPAPTTDGDGPQSAALAVPPGFDLEAALAGIGMSVSMVEDVLPATSMQVHMLSVWQNTHGAVFYPCFRYTISGHVDARTIARAWRTLTAETPALRTVFLATESRDVPILQAILLSSAVDQGHDPSPADGNDSRWSSRAAGHTRQPYNSLRAEKQGEKWLLRLKIHHALYDAVSLSAIMDRFAALCSAQGQGHDLAKPIFSLRSSSRSSATEDDKAMTRRQFWTAYLANAPFQPLPAPRGAAGETPPFRVGLVKQVAPTGGLPRLIGRCKEGGVSFQALFFAAYAEVLAGRASARPETVVFGVYLANRSGRDGPPGAHAYYCPSLRLVPLRVAPTPGPGLLEVAGRVQADLHAVSAPATVDVALWEIKDWTGVTVDSFVNFLATPLPSSGLGNNKGGEERQEEGKGQDVCWELVGEPAADGAVADEAPDRDGFERDIARELSNNPVRDAFPDAIDVEVSLQENAMTIGVFGPGQRLGGADGAATIIEGIVQVLAGVL
ncbi:hypothetical protein VTH06DRAFT_8614 [Thermothelomyces fergusii]